MKIYLGWGCGDKEFSCGHFVFEACDPDRCIQEAFADEGQGFRKRCKNPSLPGFCRSKVTQGAHVKVAPLTIAFTMTWEMGIFSNEYPSHHKTSPTWLAYETYQLLNLRGSTLIHIHKGR